MPNVILTIIKGCQDMRTNSQSRTAEGAAAMRAEHLIYDSPLVFDDPYAIELLSYPWRRACKNPALHWLLFKKIMGPLRPIQGQVLARSRFSEEKLKLAFTQGIDQCVIVGAGLDTLALRTRDWEEKGQGENQKLRIYELDHPATQEAKIKKLNRLKTGALKNLEFVSVDFERQSLAEGLKQSSFDSAKPAFFIWLGVTPYLTEEAIFNTVKSIASTSAKGSELVFDYGVNSKYLSNKDVGKLKTLKFYTSRLSEPLIENDFDPVKFPADVEKLGFQLLENMSPEQQNQCFFNNRSDNLRSTSGSYFAHFRRLP